MKAQYNKKTEMSWVYIPTSIVESLNIKKGNDIEFIKDEVTNKIEFRKTIKNKRKQITINNRYMANEELIEKLISRTMELHLQDSIDKRDLERFEAVKEEILSRMVDDGQYKVTEAQIMSPYHSKWDQFYAILDKRLDNVGCDAETLTQAEIVLKTFFPEIDIKESLKYFRLHGAYCDCEVLMNVSK
jgi:bifunctional DNA-binding transcriptional regulator/antitoxin component of YhaV-PrlF toxin-antitoxin module